MYFLLQMRYTNCLSFVNLILSILSMILSFSHIILTLFYFYFVIGISARKKRLKKVSQRPRTHEQKAEIRQRKYRYLYQVRTAHGDVISQVKK